MNTDEMKEDGHDVRNTDDTPEEKDAMSVEDEVKRALGPGSSGRAAGIVWTVLVLILAVAAGAFLRDPIMGLLPSGGEADKAPKAAAAKAVPGEDQTRYTCGMHPEIVQDEPGFCPICSMKLTPMKPKKKQRKKRLKGKAACEGREILFYQAPMDPTFTSPSPGKSPMGMDLVPVCEGDEYESETGITIDSRVRQNMGIRTTPVKKGRVRKSIRTVGYVDYDERRLATISTKIDGWVERLYVDYTGQHVDKGQRLLAIYSPALVSTQDELLLAYRTFLKTRSARDEILWKAARERLRYWDIPESQIRRIEKTGRIQRTLTIRAPMGGVVVKRNVVEGKYVEAGADLLDIADLSVVWVYVHVYEMDTPYVEVGQDVRVELPYAPGAKMPAGRVDYVFPWLETKTRDMKVRVVFDNPDGQLKPGMYVTTRIEADLGREALLVDDSAILRGGDRDVAFVETEPGTFEPRNVRLGVLTDDGFEVLDGLAEREQVVVNGQFMLDSESRLKEALTRFDTGGETSKEQEVKGAGDTGKEPGHEDGDAPAETRTPAQALDDLAQQGCAYTCPMPSHFHVCGKEPGPCPECGMQMKPIDELRKRYEAGR